MCAQKEIAEDLVLLIWAADYPDADGFVYPLLHSETGIWRSLLGSTELDRLIEQARTETAPEQRRALYRLIEEEVSSQAFLIPVLHDQFHVFARPEIQGLELNYFFPTIAFENLMSKP